MNDTRWVGTWAAMPQLAGSDNLPPPPFARPGRVLADTTLRQTIRVSVGGPEIRLRLSNAFGGSSLPISRVSVALPHNGRAGVSAIRPGSARTVTFQGRDRVVVPVGALMVSDPLTFPVAALSNVAVTLYLAEGQASDRVTAHPASRTTSYLMPGDHVDDVDLPDAVAADHWYFLSGLEVRAPGSAAALVVLGDSLTDGRGSTTNANDRWPDLLVSRLHTHPDTADVAVLNAAAGGNRVLNDGLGPNALSRLDRDVLAQSAARWLFVLHGINDIGTADATAAAQEKVRDDLIAAYDQIIVRAHTQGLVVYGATLLPFGGNTLYDDPAGRREQTRQAVNHWIRTSRRFDDVVDFDRVTRDPARPRRLASTFDEGDHLHMNPAGYQAIADAVPARLFGGVIARSGR